MRPETRRQIARFLRNIIAPGGRAFFPHELEQALRQTAASHPVQIDTGNHSLGEFWLDDDTDPLRQAKIAVLQAAAKDVHTKYEAPGQVNYAQLISLVYALWYLPSNLHKIQFVLLELFERGWLPTPIAALDVGTGVGTVPLALLDFYTLLRHTCVLFDEEFTAADVSFTCVDSSVGNLNLFRDLMSRLVISSSRVQTPLLIATTVDPAGEWTKRLPRDSAYNLAFLSNFLTELSGLSLADRCSVVMDVAKRLTDDGLLIIIEPADRENSVRYHELQRELTLAGLPLLIPCGHSNGVDGETDCARCWGYRSESLKVPEVMKPLVWSQSRSDADTTAIKWCYGVFSRQRREPEASLTTLQNVVSPADRRVDELVVQVASTPLEGGSAVKICGAEARSNLAVLRVGEYQALPPLTPGQFLRLTNPLVRAAPSSLGDYEILYDTQAEATTDGHGGESVQLGQTLVVNVEAKADTLRYFLERLFGFGSFRSGQLQVLARVLSGQDTLAVMATSAGKSLCFQLPAMLMPGVAIVVAPLLSLVQDQIYSLRSRFGFDHVERINSELSASEKERVFERMVQGHYKLIYITPEQLMNRRAIAKLKETARHHGISLFAVDEVHCLSQWGHQFRPAYLNLRRHFSEIDSAAPHRGPTPVLALTATASQYVINDVVAELDLPDDAVKRFSFDRPELSLEVVKVKSSEDRQPALLDLLDHKLRDVLARQATRPGVIFVPYTGSGLDETSDWWPFSAEGLASLLAKRGYCTKCYHGGLSADQRLRVQEAFTDGELEFLVATKGFGMGIDKANIRFVIHFCMPDSLESYYQQAGRAGRDGAHAHCVLLYELPDESRRSDDSYRTDYERQLYFVESNYPQSKDDIKIVFDYLLSSKTIRRTADRRVLYGRWDDMIVDLGWMTAEQMAWVREHGEQVCFRQKMIKAWNKGLQAALKGDHSSLRFREAMNDLAKNTSPSADRVATVDDWDYLLYKAKRKPPQLRRAVQACMHQGLGGGTLGHRRAAALAELMRDKPNRQLLKLKDERDRELKVILDSLRRMRFIHSWDTVQTIASFRRKCSWLEVAANTRDPLVLEFIDRLKRLGSEEVTEEYLRSQPSKAQDHVDLVTQSIRLEMDVMEIQSILGYLHQRRFLTRPVYTDPHLQIRLDDHPLLLSEEQRDAAFSRELELLYKRRDSQIEMLNDMEGYIHTTDCRRQRIIGYFLPPESQAPSEKLIVRCNFCDNCCPEGISGTRADVEEATRRQADLVERLRAWLEHDFAPTTLPIGSEVREICTTVAALRPAPGETPLWDLLQGICAFHLEQRFVDSWRATFLTMLCHYERGQPAASGRYLDKLVERLSSNWLAVESAAEILSEHVEGQYDVISLLLKAARHLDRPKTRQLELLTLLTELDYDREPLYLYQRGCLEATLGHTGYADFLADALAQWLRSGEWSSVAEATIGLLESGSDVCELVPDWVERFSAVFPERTLDLVNELAQKASPIQRPLVADALRRIVDTVPLSVSALSEAARIAGRIHQPQLEVDLWRRMAGQASVEKPSDRALAHQAHSALCGMFDSNPAVRDPSASALHAVLAARTAADSASAMCFYRRVLKDWDGARLNQELEWVNEHRALEYIDLSLLAEWLLLDATVDKHELACQYLADSAPYSDIQPSHIMPVLRQVPAEVMARFPDLADMWLGAQAQASGQLERPTDFARLAATLAMSGRHLSAPVAKLFGRALFEEVSSSGAQWFRRGVVKRPEDARRLLSAVSEHYCPTSPAAVSRWLDWFYQVLVSEPQFAMRLLEAVARSAPNHRSDQTAGYSDGDFDRLRHLLAILLQAPETRAMAHKTWMSACRAWPDEAPQYIRQCLALEAPLATMADDCLDLLLRNGHAAWGQFMLLVGPCPVPGRSQRVDRVVELVRLLDQLTRDSDIAVAGRLEGMHFAVIMSVFQPDQNLLRADMAAALIDVLRCSLPRTWLTPIARHVEVLGYARRFAEARTLASVGGRLTVGPRSKAEPVQEFLSRLSGEPRVAPAYDIELHRVVEIATRDWACCRAQYSR